MLFVATYFVYNKYFNNENIEFLGIAVVIGLSKVVEYLYFLPKRIILIARNSEYIINYLNLVSLAVYAIVFLIGDYLRLNLVVLMCGQLFGTFIKILLLHYFTRDFLITQVTESNLELRTVSRKFVIIQELTWLALNGIIVLSLTLNSDFTAVSIYSIYFMVFGNINMLLSLVFSSATPGLASRDLSSERGKAFYREFVRGLLQISEFGVIVALLFFKFFIIFYLGELKYEIYYNYFLMLAYALMFSIMTLRLSFAGVVGVLGLFKQIVRQNVLVLSSTVLVAILSFLGLLNHVGMVVSVIVIYLIYIYSLLLYNRNFTFIKSAVISRTVVYTAVVLVLAYLHNMVFEYYVFILGLMTMSGINVYLSVKNRNFRFRANA